MTNDLGCSCYQDPGPWNRLIAEGSPLDVTGDLMAHRVATTDTDFCSSVPSGEQT